MGRFVFDVATNGLPDMFRCSFRGSTGGDRPGMEEIASLVGCHYTILILLLVILVLIIRCCRRIKASTV